MKSSGNILVFVLVGGLLVCKVQAQDNLYRNSFAKLSLGFKSLQMSSSSLEEEVYMERSGRPKTDIIKGEALNLGVGWHYKLPSRWYLESSLQLISGPKSNPAIEINYDGYGFTTTLGNQILDIPNSEFYKGIGLYGGIEILSLQSAISGPNQLESERLYEQYYVNGLMGNLVLGIFFSWFRPDRQLSRGNSIEELKTKVEEINLSFSYQITAMNYVRIKERYLERAGQTQEFKVREHSGKLKGGQVEIQIGLLL